MNRSKKVNPSLLNRVGNFVRKFTVWFETIRDKWLTITVGYIFRHTVTRTVCLMIFLLHEQLKSKRFVTSNPHCMSAMLFFVVPETDVVFLRQTNLGYTLKLIHSYICSHSLCKTHRG